MINKFGIEKNAYESILNIFRKYDNIKFVEIFGSRARGDYKKTSDIDLAICFEKDSSKLKIIRELDEVRCILKFDVIDINEITNNLLIDNIKKDGIVIYNKAV